MTFVKGGDEPIVELLGRTMDRIRRQMLEDHRFGLRPSRLRVIFTVPEEGGSVTDLAERLGMTKQGCGQLVTTLVESGHLAEERDPTDARVRRVRRTAAGEQAMRDVGTLDAAIIAEWRETVGAERWETFHEVLREVSGVVDPDS